MPKTLIAIPCFNCSKQVVRVIDELKPFIKEDHIHFLFINNQSTDETIDVITNSLEENSFKNTLAVTNNENYGLGGSHKVAFNYAIQNKMDYVVIIHGDHQATPTEIPKLLKVAQDKKCSVLGSRFMLQSNLQGYQKSRIFGNLVLNLFFTLLTLRPTKDLGSGLNVFKTEQIKSIPLNTLSDFFNFNVDLLLSFYKNKSKIMYYPITWSETDQISNAKNFQVAWRMLKSLIRWRLFLSKSNHAGKSYTYKINYQN